MMRIAALFAACEMCLAGCFAFNNPWDTNSLPTAAFQIVVHGGLYAGTYVWSSGDNAYEAAVGSARYYIHMSSGLWWLAGPDSIGTSIAYSTSSYGALPPTSNVGWSPSGKLSTLDDSVGGISEQGGYPDGVISYGQTVHVTFKASDLGNSTTYQWERSSLQTGGSPIPNETGSTYTTQSGDSAKWIRVLITPIDSTGTIKGTPVVSPPVRVN
jgi:hypothetical protein